MIFKSWGIWNFAKAWKLSEILNKRQSEIETAQKPFQNPEKFHTPQSVSHP